MERYYSPDYPEKCQGFVTESIWDNINPDKRPGVFLMIGDRCLVAPSPNFTLDKAKIFRESFAKEATIFVWKEGKIVSEIPPIPASQPTPRKSGKVSRKIKRML